MDSEIPETVKKCKPDQAKVIPGMDQGAGDNVSSHPMALGNSKEEDMAALEACLAGLRIPESFHQQVKDAMANDEWESDDADADASTDEDSEIDIQCSYPFGYLKRQTVYTCLTCNDPTKEGWKPAGVCIGCRNACHQGHEVISLETRRSFKCDCGNKKFSQGCILCPEKEDTNESNWYNENFKGTFCTCKCKETDCIVEDPLYQCVVCEDWYHASHCNAKTEGIEKNYTDLVCGECTLKLDFLRHYEPFDSTIVVDENSIEEMIQYTETDSADEGDKKAEVIDESQCKLKTLVKKEPYTTGQLWTLGWRGKLCRCVKCKEMYASLNVSFLLDKDDEVRRYFTPSEDEDEGRLKICSAVMKFEQWLFKMNSNERQKLFSAEPDVVKQQMKEYFLQNKKDDGFQFEDEMLDQLFLAFKEYVLDVEGGVEYLDDLDMLSVISSKAQPEDGPLVEEDNQNLIINDLGASAVTTDSNGDDGFV